MSGRIAGMTGQTKRAYQLLAPLLPVTDEVFTRALAIDVEAPGANDRIHAATCLTHGVNSILSADRGFDEVGALVRVDPLDPRALRTLKS